MITADLFHAIFPDIFARGFHLLIAALSYIIYFIYECVETADYFRELEDANGKNIPLYRFEITMKVFLNAYFKLL